MVFSEVQSSFPLQSFLLTQKRIFITIWARSATALFFHNFSYPKKK